MKSSSAAYIFSICLVSGFLFLAGGLMRFPDRVHHAGVIADPARPPPGNHCASETAAADACRSEPVSGCSIFTISRGETVLFGGNDDFIDTDKPYWIDPGDASHYGAIWIGHPDNVQQGVNEKGLAYDGNGLPEVDVNPHNERTPVTGGYASYPIQILRENATVQEVIDWVNSHQRYPYMNEQLHFADASGDAVVISPGPDGEMVFTRKPAGDSFIISTNFNVANPSHGNPSWRYATAQQQLSRLLDGTGAIKAQDAAAVLDAVHVAGPGGWTIVSLVADLKSLDVYLYYFYQFDQPVVLNVIEEISNPRPSQPLSRLFPEEVRLEAARRHQSIISSANLHKSLGLTWLGLVIFSLGILLARVFKHRQAWVFWIPIVLIMGPVGLLIWLTTGRKHGPGKWQSVLIEAVGDAAPVVFSFLAVMLWLELRQGADFIMPIQVILIFFFPPAAGWFIFHGPLLSQAASGSDLSTLLQRLPHAWVSANLVLAGIIGFGLPIITVVGVHDPRWFILNWWGAIVFGGLAGMLLLIVYERWRTRKGYLAWSCLSQGYGAVVSAPWRQLRGWILGSYAALVLGMFANAFLAEIL